MATPIDWTLVDDTPAAPAAPTQTPAQSAGAAVARDLLLDADGDLAFVAGDLAFVSGLDAIRQDAACRLRFVRGEWFLAPSVGVEYHEAFFTKAPDLARIRAIYTRELLATPGIVSVQSVDVTLDANTRVLSGTFRATADTGAVITGAIGGTP